MHLRTRSTSPHPILRFAVVLALAAVCACGGSDDSQAEPDPGGATTDAGSTAVDGDAGGGASGGSGTATLTIGDETWEFDTVRCAIGSDETQSDDYDFSLSAIQDGLQLSVDRGSEGGRYGDGVEVDDIENGGDPTLSWTAPAFDPTGGGAAAEPFVEVDGKHVQAEAEFSDGTLDVPGDPVAGTLDATCP